MKICVVIKDLYVGGVQKSCVNLVNYLNEKGIDVDLVLFNKESPLFNQINESIRIIDVDKSLRLFATSHAQSKTKGIIFFIKRTLLALRCKLIGNKKPIQRALKKQHKLKDEYDIAMSFQTTVGAKSLNIGCSEFVLEKIKAKNKWAFVHGDYKRSGLNEKVCNETLLKFDKILCVSSSCAKIMRETNSIFGDKVDFLYNVCNCEEVRQKSGDEKFDRESNFTIVTVARLSEEKGHIRFLNILKSLNNEGFHFIYSIVGDGAERDKINKFIENNQMSSYVKIWGNKENPFPYIKNSDLFVLPSYHEAAPMVYAESFLCGTPVLTTNTASAIELVGDFGFVCDNDETSIYNSLKELLLNPNLIEFKKDDLKDYLYDNELILKKIKYLLRKDV